MQPDPRFLMAYCERLGNPAFWGEPLNAATNAAFLLAALLAFRLARKEAGIDPALAALAAILAAIGIGSFLFHTVPGPITVLLDVVPIQAFILVYFGLAVRRFLGLPRWAALLGPVLFFLASGALVSVAGSRALGGGIGYVPALIALFAFAFLVGRRSDYAAVAPGLGGDAARAVAAGLFRAGFVFAASLTLRTLDLPLCSAWPSGLHFLWHVLNAVVLGILVAAMAKDRRSRQGINSA